MRTLVAANPGLTPDMDFCEPVEDMAEAAVDILSRPTDYTGYVEFSYRHLGRIGRSTLSLDGSTVVVDRSRKEGRRGPRRRAPGGR